MGLIAALTRRLSALARSEESGQAMTEFVIVFPVQLLVIAAILQFALFNNAALVVNHAAFKSARAALVADEKAPRDGLPSRVGDDAQRAAVIACSTIAGSSGVAPGQTESYPGLGGTVRLPRSGAAAVKTRVRAAYHPTRRYVGAVVEHDYELIFPVVRHLFKDAEASARYGSPHATLREACYLPCPWEPRR